MRCLPRHCAHPRAASRARGFTLVELIVVIGIIIVIAGIAFPVLNSVLRQGGRAAESAALASISQALEAYKSDFGDYPRFDTNPDAALNEADDRGARLLARALFGPAPKHDETGADVEDAFQDGHDGFGFKADRQIVPDGSGGTTFYLPGPVHGPYLEADRWNLRKGPAGFDETVVILDRNERPYLYYPARQKEPDIYAGENFVAERSDPSQRQFSLYDAYDNRGLLPLQTLRTMLGDLHNQNPQDDHPDDWTPDGRINEGEQPATTGPYLLIASDSNSDPGYGPGSVANFEPQGQE